MADGVVQRRVAVVVGHVGDALEQLHAEALDVVHVVLDGVGVGVFGRRDVDPLATRDLDGVDQLLRRVVGRVGARLRPAHRVVQHLQRRLHLRARLHPARRRAPSSSRTPWCNRKPLTEHEV